MMRRAIHVHAGEPQATPNRPHPPAEEEPTRRFFRYTAMIMAAMLLPAGIQALLSVLPDLLQPRDAAAVMALALSGSIVATALLIAALVRGKTPRSSNRV